MRAKSRTFSPGFRLSWIDVVILLGGAVGMGVLVPMDFWIGVSVGFVVGHFFLFCNVLRMSRVPELVWAGVFVGLAIGAVVGVVAWRWVFGVGGGVIVVLAGIESRRACYHGVGWEWVNPGLREWWAKRPGI